MALRFTEAVEEVDEHAVNPNWLVKYLRDQGADHIASLVEKDLSVGDVHAPTALGNEKDRKKKPKLMSTVGDAVRTEEGEAEKSDPVFDTDGSSSHGFQWWLDHQDDPNYVAKLKISAKQKVKIECDPEELKALQSDPGALGAWLERALQNATVDKQNATRTVRIVRHGATRLNNNTDTSSDRVRGWKDVPLSPEGRDEAEKLAKKIAKDPPDVIVCSDLKRAHDTAQMIADACGMDIAEVSKAFRPWDVGDYAGTSTKDAIPVLARYAIEKPDQPVPGGETFNTFRNRFMSGLSDALDKYDGVVAVVTHHRDERLLNAWEKAGFPPDGTIDGKEFTKKGEATAHFEDMEIPQARLRAAAQATLAKWVNPPDDYAALWQDGDAITFPLDVMKVDNEQQIFYGWAYVSEENGQILVDKQDDYILPEDLLKAAEDFTLHGGKLGDMHEERNVGRVVASFVTTADLCNAFGLQSANNRRGWILGFKVESPEVWKKIKAGDQLELSIGGKGERRET